MSASLSVESSGTNALVLVASVTPSHTALPLEGGNLTGPLTLVSTDDGGANDTDSTSRVTVQSYQIAQKTASDGVTPAHFGEGIRLDLMEHSAKNMIAWRDNTGAEPRTVAWVGAHLGANNPENADHDHFSIEVTDSTDQLQTRMEFPVDLDHTNIKVSSADFMVGDACKFIIASGAAGTHRDFEFHTGTDGADANRRWTYRADNGLETGSNAGSNFLIVRRDDAGNTLGQDGVTMKIIRSNGRIGINDPSPGAMMSVRALDTSSDTLRLRSSTGTSQVIFNHNGEATFNQKVTVNSTLVLKSPDGSSFSITVGNDGTLSAVPL